MSMKADPIHPLNKAETEEQERETLHEAYWHRCLVAIDICCNVIFLRGLQDETISSHAARAALKGRIWGVWLSRFLNLFQPDHGADAIAGDAERAKRTLAVEESTKILNENEKGSQHKFPSQATDTHPDSLTKDSKGDWVRRSYS